MLSDVSPLVRRLAAHPVVLSLALLSACTINTKSSDDDATSSSSATTGGGAGSSNVAYPSYAGTGTLRLTAEGDGLSGYDSVAKSVNAVESHLVVEDLQVYAYFGDSGNRVVLRFPSATPGEYPIGHRDTPGVAVVDVLLNTDTTGRPDRIEGDLASGTLRLDEIDTASGKARAVWVGVLDPKDVSGIESPLDVGGALDVTVKPVP